MLHLRGTYSRKLVHTEFANLSLGYLIFQFGETQIKRMVRILRSTVMVRVGGGWEALDIFLSKHDPCRARGRLNIEMFYKDVAPSNAIDTMRAFTKGRHRSTASKNVTSGPVMKVREKTERSIPMFSQRQDVKENQMGEANFCCPKLVR
ncbi:unnamed protein product [Angiostrongylus costaricensis]|uniref:GAR domain-containing protein n=1 Tax=Angiostrongylus costaricensis TaxID=334426 RepID=A0A158PK78_ANGCS|nr:unnamed protein product [Angiostrongylus costaricensis]